jgi:hypothetical protein
MTRYEAFIEKSWRENGLTQLLVARIRADGRAEIGFFLIDLWCLGVKDAFLYDDGTESAFRELITERLPEEFRERLHPACAKKLVDGALAYAADLGFAPPRDYRKARRALSGLDASACPESFTFGRDGRPCYVKGPHDTPDRVERVLAILSARRGADGFDYEPVDDEADTEDDRLDARGALRMFFDDLGPASPDFYEFAGLVAALHLCPTPVTPAQLLARLFGPDGHPWRDEDDLKDFTDDLGVYWNMIADLFAACAAAPAGDTDANPIDLYRDDFDESDEKIKIAHLASAQVLWSRGFLRATREWPEAWGDALVRPDLAPHWHLIGAWAAPEKPESLETLRQSNPSLPGNIQTDSLRQAILALLRALRPTTYWL